MSSSLRFRTEPDIRSIFERELGQPRGREDRHGWAAFAAPGCHKSQSGRSFAVNLKTGGWCCCAGCGKGGDVISFVMWRHKLSFLRAIQFLGLEIDRSGQPSKPAPPKSIERRLAEAVVDGPRPNPSRDYRVKVREELHQARQLFHNISERLAADQSNEELWQQLEIAHADLEACEILYAAACEELA